MSLVETSSSFFCKIVFTIKKTITCTPKATKNVPQKLNERSVPPTPIKALTAPVKDVERARTRTSGFLSQFCIFCIML